MTPDSFDSVSVVALRKVKAELEPAEDIARGRERGQACTVDWGVYG